MKLQSKSISFSLAVAIPLTQVGCTAVNPDVGKVIGIVSTIVGAGNALHEGKLTPANVTLMVGGLIITALAIQADREQEEVARRRAQYYRGNSRYVAVKVPASKTQGKQQLMKSNYVVMDTHENRPLDGKVISTEKPLPRKAFMKVGTKHVEVF